ncbi:MAG: ABC transporter substrate-binding protein, partial [Pseudobdellovibrionaceae bacterium]
MKEQKLQVKSPSADVLSRSPLKAPMTALLIGSMIWATSCTKKDGATTDGASATTSTSGPTNAELKMGISQEFENFNPLVATMAATTYMYTMVNRTLVYLDVDAKWQPQMATTIPTLENGLAKITTVGGKKVLTAQWEILESAKWGDGVPVTCKDFALARKIAASPNVTVGEKETYTLVEKIEFDAATPKKCLFTYEKIRWDFNQLGQFKPLPAHLEEAVFEKFGKEPQGYEKNSIFSKDPTNKGLYNGPYVISEVKLGDHVTFEPNPNFYGSAPKIKKIIVKLIQNTGTMEANLRSGTIDMISTLGLTFDQALEFEKKVQAESLPFIVSFTPSLVYEHIDFNLDHPILKDLKVRQAMIHAIDRDSLTKSLFEGKQIPAIHYSSPKDPWFADAS